MDSFYDLFHYLSVICQYLWLGQHIRPTQMKQEAEGWDYGTFMTNICDVAHSLTFVYVCLFVPFLLITLAKLHRAPSWPPRLK